MTERDLSARARRWLARLLVALASGATAVALGFDSLAVPLTRWRLGRGDLLLGAALAWGLAWVGRRSPPRVALALASGLAGLLLLVPWAVHAPRRGDVTVKSVGARVEEGLGRPAPPPERIWVSDTEWYEPHGQPHPRYGYGMIPNSQARHHHRDFDVVYHCDAGGWRRMPATADQATNAPEIAFLGCSFVFGWGLDDGEPFPALLAAQAWPHRRVGNYSSIGWGTAHAAVIVDDLLAQSTPPAAIGYGYITDHRRRNYRRKSYYALIQRSFPSFERGSDGLEYRGLLPAHAADWQDGPELEAREIEITLGLIERMHQRCQAQGTLFFVLLLEYNNDSVVESLQEAGLVNLIDLSEVSTARHVHDWHPSAVWHRQVARALARLDVLGRAVGDRGLVQPEAIARVAEPWDLDLNWGGGAEAQPLRNEDPPVTYRVQNIRGITDLWGGVRIARTIPCQVEGSVRLSAEVRSDVSGTVFCHLAPTAAVTAVLGQPADCTVGPEWRTIECEVTLSTLERRPRWVIDGLGALGQFEIRNSHAWQGDRDLFQEEPPVAVSLVDAPAVSGDR